MSFASVKCVVASTIALARRAGSSDLKIPDPTKFPSAPSCMVNAASAGVAMPPAQNMTTGSAPAFATSRTSSTGTRYSSALAARPASSMVASSAIADVIARRCRTASTMFPVPASPLLRIIAAPSLMRRSASPRSRAPQTNGTLNPHLLM